MTHPSSADLGDVILHTAGAYRRVQRAAGLELSPHLARALKYVLKFGQLRIGHLAELLQVTPRTAGLAVEGLVAQGLVVRTTDPQDRRAQVVSPTGRARSTYDAVEAGREEVARRFFERLTPEDRLAVVTLLLRVDSDARAPLPTDH